MVSTLNHIGIIMDGNRRWAKAKGLSTLEGHKKGLEALVNIAELTFKKGIKFLTVYAFSTENWNRSEPEVNYLMKLTMVAFKKYLKLFDDQNIRLIFIGSFEGLNKKIVQQFKEAEDMTKNNATGTLGICFNYGGQQEIIDTCNKILNEGKSKTYIKDFEQYLYFPEIPQIDLLIRTSGEKRISNFMLWRAAYSELYFTKTLWPDFNNKELDKACEEYALRQRRYGV